MGQQIRMTVFALIACAAFAQNNPSSQGETALKTQFVEVQRDVKLEVLDWGGAGRSRPGRGDRARPERDIQR